MPTSRALIRLLLIGPPLLVGCGSHTSAVSPAPASQGVSSEFISPPMSVVAFTRFAANTIAFDWDARQRLDSSWHYDASNATWARVDSGYSTVYVGSLGGGTTELRDESVVDMRVRFLRLGVAQADLMTADQARLQLRVRQRRYAVGDPYVPEVTYDLETRTATRFGLTNGSADTMMVLGSLLGWWEHAVGLGRQRYDYGGTIDIELEFPDHFIVCPAERLSADILVFEGGVEVDRFRGTFQADQGEEVYTGFLQSERGPWRFSINESRGCSSAVRTTQAGAWSNR